MWDAMVFWNDDDFIQPLSAEHWTKTGKISEIVRKENPKSSLGDDWFKTPKDWASESHELASTFVYPLVKEGSWPSDDYIEKGQKIAQKRVAQAGYRLA